MDGFRRRPLQGRSRGRAAARTGYHGQPGPAAGHGTLAHGAGGGRPGDAVRRPAACHHRNRRAAGQLRGAALRRSFPNPAARTIALSEYAQQTFGFVPFEAIELAVPEAGLTGMAFVLPTAANLAAQAGHRVYLRRMLIAEGVDKLLPEWAFFVRCVVNADELRPTASREALYEDDLLTATREALGTQIKDWLVQLAATAPDRLARFLNVHHLGVKAVALHDLEMLRIVDYWWPMETSAGPMTLASFRRRFPVVRYTRTTDEFRELAGVADAQGIGLVNGGYAYDAEIMNRLPALDSTVCVQILDPTDLVTRFEPPDPAIELRLRPLLGRPRGPVADGLRRRAALVRPAFCVGLVPGESCGGAGGRGARGRDAATGVWSDVLASLDSAGLLGRTVRRRQRWCRRRATAAPAHAQPAQPGGAPDHRADRPEPGRPGRPGVVRAGPAAGTPPATVAGQRTAQQVVHGPA